MILSHIFVYNSNMKKRDVINLIRYHVENNDTAFKDQAYAIADDFGRLGDTQLASYICSLLSSTNTFIPQNMLENSVFLYKVEPVVRPLPLPEAIHDDITGIMNATSRDPSINKFLFAGAPGTGKTESAKQLARLLGRQLYAVDTASLIDSRLGQSAKNIARLFNEIDSLYAPDQVMILFDEMDALAMGRLDSHDLREMGRVTSAVLKGFDNLIPSVLIVATTNLLDNFDKALLRRFDKVVDFDRYSNEDLVEIADSILDVCLQRFSFARKDTRLFHKILALKNPLPYPGDLQNIIRSCVAFSDPSDGHDYLRRLYKQFTSDSDTEVKILKDKGFTLREIEVLSSVSKSSLSRMLKKEICQ